MSGSKTTFTKKEREQKKIKKRKGKEERKEERLASSSKGKGLEDMMAYVDENGNLSSVPPSLIKKAEKPREYSADIQNAESDATDRIGSIHFFNEQKGYGFIKDAKTNESIFVHINELNEPVKEKDKVSFQIKMRPKGPVAVEVKKIG